MDCPTRQPSPFEEIEKSFQHASDELTDDEEFMMKAANFNGAVYHVASKRLRENADFGLTAYNCCDRRGEKSDFGKDYDGCCHNVHFDLFHNQLRRTSFCLLKHAVFEWLIRPAMAQTVNAKCPLTLLNRRTPYEDLIEDFVGVPRGRALAEWQEHHPKELDRLAKRREKYPLSSFMFLIP